MKEIVFWEIIEQTIEERTSFKNQINLLIEKLSNLSEKEIVEFEFRFRETLILLVNYNIMAAAKIINGFLSDDSFLYFRARLVAEGKELFYKSIENPDYLADIDIQEFEIGGEEMLYIADDAYIKKFGDDTDKELPRDIANNLLNYDQINEIKGEDWLEEDLPRKYPKLWKKYKTKYHL